MALTELRGVPGVTAPWFAAWHLGPMHPLEQVLTLVLAVAPFVVLGIVVAVRRRSEDRDG